MLERQLPLLKVAPEVECFPLWVRHDREHGIFENLDHAALDISPGLKQKIEALAPTWDSQYNLQDPRDIAGKDLDVDAYTALLHDVFHGLATELRGEYDVILG